MRKEYMEKVKAQLRDWGKDMERLRAKADKVD